MPLGTYVNLQGEERELYLPHLAPEVTVDGQTWLRVQAPERIIVGGSRGEPTPAEQVKATCYGMECAGKWESGYSKDTIKKVWKL